METNGDLSSNILVTNNRNNFQAVLNWKHLGRFLFQMHVPLPIGITSHCMIHTRGIYDEEICNI